MEYTIKTSSSGYHHGHGRGQADPRRHRGAARRHHQAGDKHQGAPRHVHGHGHAGRESGMLLFFGGGRGGLIK